MLMFGNATRFYNTLNSINPAYVIFHSAVYLLYDSGPLYFGMCSFEVNILSHSSKL